jgi:hypothetical protein
MEAAMAEYLLEPQKFIQRARQAYSAEARNQNLDMAEWCISRAIAETGFFPPRRAKPARASAFSSSRSIS